MHYELTYPSQGVRNVVVNYPNQSAFIDFDEQVISIETIQQKLKEILPAGSSILDIGAGKKEHHAKWFRNCGYNVDTVEYFKLLLHHL